MWSTQSTLYSTIILLTCKQLTQHTHFENELIENAKRRKQIAKQESFGMHSIYLLYVLLFCF